MALVNEGFNSIGFKPIKRGDESDEEDDDPNFRSEMYQNRPTFPQKKISDRDISMEHNRMQAVFALKHILTKDARAQKQETTIKLQTEMNWVATQARDLLYDLKAELSRDPTAKGDVLELEALKFLETELAALVRAE